MLHIGNQSRPKMFSLSIDRPEVLYSRVVEIPERVTLEAWTESQKPVPINLAADPTLVHGVTGEVVRIIKPIGQSDIIHLELTELTIET